MKLFRASITLFFLIISVYNLFGQQQEVSKDEKLKRLGKIYRNLEYNTIAFDDLKERWNVTDPLYVREIYNRFVNENVLTVNGKKPSLNELKEKTEDIHNGNVFIELRRRYYDDEIEELRFFTESKLEEGTRKDYLFDPIKDNVYIRKILDQEIYKDLKGRFYANTDLTKSVFDSKISYNFDIYMNLLNPKLLVWSETTSKKNKYLVSFFGKWGNDHIIFPGWYYSDYFTGLRVSYIDYVKNNEQYYSYYMLLGTGVPAKEVNFEFATDLMDRRLYHSGMNLFFQLGGNPLRLIDENWDNFIFELEGVFSLTEYKTNNYEMAYMSKFYSNRNYITFYAEYNDIFNFMNFGWFYGGLSLGSYDIYHYLYDPKVSSLEEINPSPSGNFKHVFNAEVGLKSYTGLIKHQFALTANYNMVENYGYAGLKANFLLSNSIGLDFKFYKSFNISQSGLPFYRDDTYIVFSPIIRINY